MEFPRTLYKKGGPKKWGKGFAYSDILVKSQDEYDSAIEVGYIDDFNEALFCVKDDEEDEIIEEDDLTKNEIIEELKKIPGLKFNPRDKRAVLYDLLESVVNKK